MGVPARSLGVPARSTHHTINRRCEIAGLIGQVLVCRQRERVCDTLRHHAVQRLIDLAFVLASNQYDSQRHRHNSFQRNAHPFCSPCESATFLPSENIWV